MLTVTTSSLFRVASLSKPITAVAILKLAEEGKLKLDQRFLDFVDIEPHFEQGQHFDERISSIRIRQLLHHSGGWDRERSYDPMFASKHIAEQLEVKSPASTSEIIRYMLGRPLDFEPGSKYAYSNLVIAYLAE